MTLFQDDAAAIAAVRQAFVTADAASDADAMNELLADDVVILHPDAGVIDGRDAACAFMREVFAEVHAQFDKQVSYTTLELRIGGDIAFERGHLAQRLTPRDGGDEERDEGMYLWIFTRAGDRAWKIARIAGTFAQPDEPAAC